MKHKTNVGPGLIVAQGAPGEGTRPTAPNALSDAVSGVSDTGDRATGGGSATCDLDTVPLDMLAMPDDQEQMQPPEVGDVVNYQVTGKVVAIEGNDAKVQRQSINGQELPDASPDENNDSNNPQNVNQDEDGDESGSLRNQAAGIGMLS